MRARREEGARLPLGQQQHNDEGGGDDDDDDKGGWKRKELESSCAPPSVVVLSHTKRGSSGFCRSERDVPGRGDYYYIDSTIICALSLVCGGLAEDEAVAGGG